jgi:hypothetical protein
MFIYAHHAHYQSCLLELSILIVLLFKIDVHLVPVFLELTILVYIYQKKKKNSK